MSNRGFHDFGNSRRPVATLLAAAMLLSTGGACADDPAGIIDDCRVVGQTSCSAGCEAIVSVPSPGIPCAHAGVFFGCAPQEGSRFWNRATDLWEGVCDIAVADEPDFVYYCFKGRPAIYWYQHHASLFCSSTPCVGEVVDNCVDH